MVLKPEAPKAIIKGGQPMPPKVFTKIGVAPQMVPSNNSGRMALSAKRMARLARETAPVSSG